jgi:two-component system sensor histidine kinase DesK
VRLVRRWLEQERRQHGRPLPAGHAGAMLVWLVFIVFPVVDAATDGDSAHHRVLALVLAVAFTTLYVWMVVVWSVERAGNRLYPQVGGALVIAIVLSVAVSPNWGYLFSYVAACVALVAPSPYGFAGVAATAVVSIAAPAIGGGTAGSAIGDAASALGVGLLITLMRDLRLRNHELSEARAELARTAVAAERERFARDLHDLLGHSLSVIAIKAELAGRLLPADPDRAASEVADLETVARTALGEVRDAVSGYRRPTLTGELEGARVALTAAGIAAEFDRSAIDPPPAVEAVLAWTVREGATNVIRHSGARSCAVTVVAAADGGVGVEIVDDGSGCSGGGWIDGNGLAGLHERAAEIGGRLEAGGVPGGAGFRVAVLVDGKAVRTVGRQAVGEGNGAAAAADPSLLTR